MCVRIRGFSLQKSYLMSPLTVDSDVIFWSPELKVGEETAFQITLFAPRSVTISSLPFSRIAIHFSNRNAPVIIEHQLAEEQEEGGRSDSLTVVELGHLSEDDDTPGVWKGNLRWGLGASMVLIGSMTSNVPTMLKVSRGRMLQLFRD